MGCDKDSRQQRYDEDVAAPTYQGISAAKRNERQKAVDFARSSLNLSGLQVSEEQESLARRYVRGEIELAEFLQRCAPATQGKDL